MLCSKQPLDVVTGKAFGDDQTSPCSRTARLYGWLCLQAEFKRFCQSRNRAGLRTAPRRSPGPLPTAEHGCFSLRAPARERRLNVRFWRKADIHLDDAPEVSFAQFCGSFPCYLPLVSLISAATLPVNLTVFSGPVFRERLINAGSNSRLAVVFRPFSGFFPVFRPNSTRDRCA